MWRGKRRTGGANTNDKRQASEARGEGPERWGERKQAGGRRTPTGGHTGTEPDAGYLHTHAAHGGGRSGPDSREPPAREEHSPQCPKGRPQRGTKPPAQVTRYSPHAGVRPGSGSSPATHDDGGHGDDDDEATRPNSGTRQRRGTQSLF